MDIFRAEHSFSAPSCPHLLCHQVIRPPQQDLRGQVSAPLSTEGAGDDKGLEGTCSMFLWNSVTAGWFIV